MVKNIILYIFIYVFLIGCGVEPYCDECKLELSIESLQIDENNYYVLNFNDDYVQTFTKIKADVGKDYEYVEWTSNTHFKVETFGYQEEVNVVNGVGYSDEYGYAYTMMGVYQSNIGDTVIIYCGYYDDYGVQYLDSLGVIINE
tara:strand:- start:113 stop:544 length:432 start_codon:yes stop_codon:yes gene_type:complete